MSLNIGLSENTDNSFYSSKEIAGIHFKIFSTARGISNIFLNKKNANIKSANVTILHSDDPLMFNIFEQLIEYFNGKRKEFNVPLDLHGSDFQLKTWNELLKIPFGKVISYKTLSKRLGDRNLVRAVGKANGSNPVPVLVPCHRVINNDGSLGGYSAGLSIKEKLLELEGVLSLKLFN